MSDAGSSTDGQPRGAETPEAAALPGPAAEDPAPAAAAAPQPEEAPGGNEDGSHLTDDKEPLLTKISRLKSEQSEMRKRRQQLTRDLKNAEKRRTRLRKRARQLSDADLRAVLEMRKPADDEPTASDRAAEPASSSAGAAPAGAGANS